MTANVYDNATIEAFWSTLKQELVYRRRWITRSQATTAIFDHIESFYNRSRLHSPLGFTSPLDYESNLNQPLTLRPARVRSTGEGAQPKTSYLDF